MKVYWLIARSKHGMLLQLLSGLITYILFLLYCSINFDEPPNIKRLRELRWCIHSEAVFSLVFLSLRDFLPDFSLPDDYPNCFFKILANSLPEITALNRSKSAKPA